MQLSHYTSLRHLKRFSVQCCWSAYHVVSWQCLCSYNMATGSLDDRLLFKRFKFHYAVFDEGHMLKNMASARYKGLARIQASGVILNRHDFWYYYVIFGDCYLDVTHRYCTCMGTVCDTEFAKHCCNFYSSYVGWVLWPHFVSGVEKVDLLSGRIL